MGRSRLIIGSRGSKLALCQAQWVKAGLKGNFPDLSIEIEVIKTSGDAITDAPLSRLGGKGLFTKEIEEALLEGRVDLAVHSLKDLPTMLPTGLCLAAITEREDARDALVSDRFKSLAALPTEAHIGTSSLRRQSQLLHWRSDLKISNVRGNLDTRLHKLEANQYDAIVLASAGLIRMGYAQHIAELIPIEQLCPAVGQGALGIETRSEDFSTLEKVQPLNHHETQLATGAERAFLKQLGGGCQVPIAGHALLEEHTLFIQGVIASPDGLQFYRDSIEAKIDGLREAEVVGSRLAEKMLATGAGSVVGEVLNRA